MHFPSDFSVAIKKHSPSLYNTLVSMWGSPQLDLHLEGLLVHDHSIAPMVRNEVQNLYIIHKDHYTFNHSTP